jgi:hypothetical protein
MPAPEFNSPQFDSRLRSHNQSQKKSTRQNLHLIPGIEFLDGLTCPTLPHALFYSIAEYTDPAARNIPLNEEPPAISLQAERKSRRG